MPEVKQNALRGIILEFLKTLYPDGADRRMIISTLYQYHKVDDIVESAEYLVDKGYATKKELPHPYKRQDVVCIYKISVFGIDLMDGNLKSDPGVTIPRVQ
jgi:hypothetical protein